MEIKCFKCESCLDLGTCDSPSKKAPITDCFCHRGRWDGSDYIGEDITEWVWNHCQDFKERIKLPPDRARRIYQINLENSSK